MANINTYKILVVDDEILIRNVLKRTLQTLPISTDLSEAVDGAEAIEMLKHNAFDLVLLDINMPVVGGLETLGWIRANHATRDLAVIMLTGENSPEDIYTGRDIGATFYLTKPFHPADLAALVNAHLQGDLA